MYSDKNILTLQTSMMGTMQRTRQSRACPPKRLQPVESVTGTYTMWEKPEVTEDCLLRVKSTVSGEFEVDREYQFHRDVVHPSMMRPIGDFLVTTLPERSALPKARMLPA
jgi:hypothetical protein